MKNHKLRNNWMRADGTLLCVISGSGNKESHKIFKTSQYPKTSEFSWQKWHRHLKPQLATKEAYMKKVMQ
jgi:hypothetical protein